MNRREALKVGAGIGAGLTLGCLPAFDKSVAEVVTKPIPSSGEPLCVVGIGTARNFNRDLAGADLEMRRQVVEQFPVLGGNLIDTAPSYGGAETIVGNLVDEIGNRDKLFLATKVRKQTLEEGLAELEASFKILKTDMIDLIQVHNLVGIDIMLPVLSEWKGAGRIRYVGATTSSGRQHEDFADMMGREKLDFVQVNYSLADRAVEDKILPLAADRGMAVLVNLPYGRGRLFDAVGDRPLPDWASEFDCESWGQFFLKYIVSHPAVTVAIPGTYKMAYLTDNLGAAMGRMPTAEHRSRMEAFYDSL